jgi:hypothetical protein
MFDATLGRFLQRDPAGYAAGDDNLYDYAAGRPTGASDPTGLDPVAAGKALATSVGYCCRCVDAARSNYVWDESQIKRYAKAKENPKNKTGRDIEKDVSDQLEKEGIKTVTAGATSPSGQVMVEESEGPCAAVDKADTVEHEAVHKATRDVLAKKYEDLAKRLKVTVEKTAEFQKEWNDAKNWAGDDINAYGAGRDTMGAFLNTCREKFKVTTALGPPCCPHRRAGLALREHLIPLGQ